MKSKRGREREALWLASVAAALPRAAQKKRERFERGRHVLMMDRPGMSEH